MLGRWWDHVQPVFASDPPGRAVFIEELYFHVLIAFTRRGTKKGHRVTAIRMIQKRGAFIQELFKMKQLNQN